MGSTATWPQWPRVLHDAGAGHREAREEQADQAVMAEARQCSVTMALKDRLYFFPKNTPLMRTKCTSCTPACVRVVAVDVSIRRNELVRLNGDLEKGGK